MFKFKLASVLSLREKMEESKKRELGVATMEMQQIAEYKAQLIHTKASAIEEARIKKESYVDVKCQMQFQHYTHRLNHEIEVQDVALEKAKQVVEEKRNALVEAVKDRKILDNLKSIEEEVFNEEEKRDEQRILDDMVTYRYGNRERSDA